MSEQNVNKDAEDDQKKVKFNEEDQQKEAGDTEHKDDNHEETEEEKSKDNVSDAHNTPDNQDSKHDDKINHDTFKTADMNETQDKNNDDNQGSDAPKTAEEGKKPSSLERSIEKAEQTSSNKPVEEEATNLSKPVQEKEAPVSAESSNQTTESIQRKSSKDSNKSNDVKDVEIDEPSQSKSPSKDTDDAKGARVKFDTEPHQDQEKPEKAMAEDKPSATKSPKTDTDDARKGTKLDKEPPQDQEKTEKGMEEDTSPAMKRDTDDEKEAQNEVQKESNQDKKKPDNAIDDDKLTAKKSQRTESEDENEAVKVQIELSNNKKDKEKSDQDVDKAQPSAKKSQTDKDDESEASNELHTDSNQAEAKQENSPARPSRFGNSLNSRSNNHNLPKEDSASRSGSENDLVGPAYMTDDDKLSDADHQEVKTDDQKSEENVQATCNVESDTKSESNESHNADPVTSERDNNTSQSTKEPPKTNTEDSQNTQTSQKIYEKPIPAPKQTPDKTQKSPSSSPQREKPSAAKPKTATSIKQPEKSSSPRQIVERDKPNNRRMAKSACYPSNQTSNRYSYSTGDDSARTVSSRASSRWSRAPSRPRTCGYISEERRRKEKEFFYAELNRLKDSLKKESKKIKKPKVRDHYPDVFTSLEPYYNTYTADYLINMPDMGYKVTQPETAREPEKKQHTEDEDTQELKYTSRSTAIGLTDPWDSLNMDRSVLPKIETSEMRKKRMDQMNSEPKRRSANPAQTRPATSPAPKKRPEAKQGSTRLPKFPVIQPPNSELTTKELSYGDVPMLREEMKSFSHSGETKKKSDYNRTKQDFYRMELDRMEEYHQFSRPHMRAAYFAYLQNTPGSKQAVYDCVKEMKGKKEKPMTPQAVA